MSQYPVIAAGQRITTSLLNAMMPAYVNKGTNTVRTSTATVADDPDLTFQLAANSSYFVEIYIKYDTTSNASTNLGLKTAWTVPSGAAGTRTSIGAGSTQAADDNVSSHHGVHAFTTTVTYGRRSGGNQLWALETAVVDTTSAGTLALQWAQDTSSTASVTVHTDSFMRIKQLA
jgi:hypothetical protein